MTTALIIVCVVACVGVVVAIVGHLGHGVAKDVGWRRHIERHHRARQARRSGRRTSATT